MKSIILVLSIALSVVSTAQSQQQPLEPLKDIQPLTVEEDVPQPQQAPDPLESIEATD